MRTRPLIAVLIIVLAIASSIQSRTAFAADPACDVRLSQATLRALDFDPGAIDGLWGQATARAISEFQNGNQLSESGELDEATCAALDSARQSGADYQAILDEADGEIVVRRDWCGRENLRLQCNAGEMLMMSGNVVPCGMTLKTFKDEVGGGMVFEGTHSGSETACQSLNDFCAYAQAAFGNGFAATCDGRESFGESACHEKLWNVCDQ